MPAPMPTRSRRSWHAPPRSARRARRRRGRGPGSAPGIPACSRARPPGRRRARSAEIAVLLPAFLIPAVVAGVRAAWAPWGQSMLASITPLRERSRGFSWGVTASAFAVGAVGAGAAGGALGGALGSLAPGGTWRMATGLTVLVAAIGFDATPLRRRLPTRRRQVTEDW